MQYLYTAYPPEETPEAAPAAESSQDGPESDPATEGSETTPDGSVTTPGGSGDGTEETPCASEEPEEPEVPEVKPDANGVILPAEYKGFTIESDTNGYFYKNSADETVYCYFKGWKDESDSLKDTDWPSPCQEVKTCARHRARWSKVMTTEHTYMPQRPL